MAETITLFVTGTVSQTIFLITLVYIMFGMISNYTLAVYQYGFEKRTYAMLRSCMMFLSGFVINEQTIFYSFESLENLINMNSYGITFFSVLVLNILIRQIALNVVAIYMHNDYHKATFIFRDSQEQKLRILNNKFEKKARERYIQSQQALVK